MDRLKISFNDGQPVSVRPGSSIADAAKLAGIALVQPCGGQGRCGRCAVKVLSGAVRRRSTLRLAAEDVAAGYALACQSLVESDASVLVPEQESLERRLTSDREVADVTVPADYQWRGQQSVQRIPLNLSPPSMDDQRDDWSRLSGAITGATGIDKVEVSLPLLRQMGAILRQDGWRVTALVDTGAGDGNEAVRLLSLQPGLSAEDLPILGASIDIGTTTVTVWLVDLISGHVLAQAAEYNRQISCGEDVISRVIFSGKNHGREELRRHVLTSINTLIDRACEKASRRPTSNRENRGVLQIERCEPQDIVKATIAGNSIMMHLLLGIPAESIRQSPFVTAINHLPPYTAEEVGLNMYPEATVRCLPGVASYVGADITSGVLSSGLAETERVSLFMDIGTNGELVLGNRDWLVTCACSAGPAFEGAGVKDGIRATHGAIEEVWIDGHTYEPTLRVIGGREPRGLCGSGLISLLSEMFLTGVIDKGGHFNSHLPSARIRRNKSAWEYVVAWADETKHGEDITITRVDIDNLIRAKAAIYAGITVLADSVGVPLATVEQVLIGGAFGKYINIEKAVQIGLLPDMPWESFRFLGNTAVLGAYYALLRESDRHQIGEIAGRMTYIELSADNSFYEAFTSALFLPHTDNALFPTVAAELASVVSGT